MWCGACIRVVTITFFCKATAVKDNYDAALWGIVESPSRPVVSLKTNAYFAKITSDYGFLKVIMFRAVHLSTGPEISV